LFFVLSKTVGTLLLPTNFLICLGLVGATLLARRWARLGRGLLTAAVVGLAICGFSPLGSWLFYPLEQRFPPWDPATGAPDGIVVLGGAIETDPSVAHGVPALTSSAARLFTAAALAYRYPKARILYTGGNASLASDDAAKEADYATAVFESLGIAKERVILERASRNTFENAEFSKLIAAPKPGEHWLLVTSAYHMPRSVGIFRKVGFPVEPCPTDWRLAGTADLSRWTVVALDGLIHTDLAVREWIGLLAYWLTGRTSALFPGPNPP
jgi:uncharacterized SAM-binding protein YcdF (DUF218 family)